jgi:hypothetical protein
MSKPSCDVFPIKLSAEQQRLMLVIAEDMWRTARSPRDTEQLEDDLRHHGCYITRDGKRVDPNDFYLNPPEVEQ